MGRQDCGEHEGLSRAIKENNKIANELRQTQKQPTGGLLRRDDGIWRVLEDAIVACQRAETALVLVREAHIESCTECRKGD